jgi:hypothetical protein
VRLDGTGAVAGGGVRGGGLGAFGKMEPMLQFFAYEHLKPELREVSRPFGELASRMVETLPRNPERTAGLRKLLEAKDCAVRALLFKQE